MLMMAYRCVIIISCCWSCSDPSYQKWIARKVSFTRYGVSRTHHSSYRQNEPSDFEWRCIRFTSPFSLQLLYRHGRLIVGFVMVHTFCESPMTKSKLPDLSEGQTGHDASFLYPYYRYVTGVYDHISGSTYPILEMFRSKWGRRQWLVFVVIFVRRKFYRF